MSELLAFIAPPDTIETVRLRLRPPVAADADAVAAIANDRELADRLARLPHPYDVDDARWFLANIVPVETVWAIRRRFDEVLIGLIGFTPGSSGQAELGYWLGGHFWGEGFMTEATRAVVAYGFDELKLSVQTASWFEDNPASGRVLEKLGFEQVDIGERSSGVSGQLRRTVEMRLARPGPLFT